MESLSLQARTHENLDILATLRLGGSWFALNALLVQEVITVPAVTPVYSAPPYVRGIINLRGKIITVFDTAKRLGLPPVVRDARNRIMVVPGEVEPIGLLVEQVGDIAYPEPDALRALPKNVPAEQARFYLGVVRCRGKLFTLLNPKPLFDAQTSPS